MSFMRLAAKAVIAGAVSVSTLGLGGALGTANADNGVREQPCLVQFCQGGRHDNDERFDHRLERRWDQRGFDDGRRDHRPFSFRGHRVEPFFDQRRGGWGFWFLGSWILF
jgi:hypothetical protein